MIPNGHPTAASASCGMANSGRGEFTWGYHGNGPDDLAEALITDVLASHARCPACLGAAPCGADMCTATRVMTPA